MGDLGVAAPPATNEVSHAAVVGMGQRLFDNRLDCLILKLGGEGPASNTIQGGC